MNKYFIEKVRRRRKYTKEYRIKVVRIAIRDGITKADFELSHW